MRNCLNCRNRIRVGKIDLCEIQKAEIHPSMIDIFAQDPTINCNCEDWKGKDENVDDDGTERSHA